MKLEVNHPMGPFEVIDFIGLEPSYSLQRPCSRRPKISNMLHPFYSERWRLLDDWGERLAKAFMSMDKVNIHLKHALTLFLSSCCFPYYFLLYCEITWVWSPLHVPSQWYIHIIQSCHLSSHFNNACHNTYLFAICPC